MMDLRIGVTGASGQLGAYLVEALAAATHDLVAWSGTQKGERSGIPLIRLDLTDEVMLARALDKASPDAVIHAAAISKPSSVFEQRERAWVVNVEATRRIADWCDRRQRRLVFTSTDLVFDGTRGWYSEGDGVSPLGAYAQTKVAAEAAVTTISNGLVARMALMFGPAKQSRPGYFDTMVAALRSGRPQKFFHDELRTPLDYGTAAHALAGLIESAATGIVHVAGGERLSRVELMTQVARGLGLDEGLIQSNSLRDLTWSEPRAADCSLRSDRLMQLLPDLRRPTPEAVARTWEFADSGS